MTDRDVIDEQAEEQFLKMSKDERLGLMCAIEKVAENYRDELSAAVDEATESAATTAYQAMQALRSKWGDGLVSLVAGDAHSTHLSYVVTYEYSDLEELEKKFQPATERND